MGLLEYGLNFGKLLAADENGDQKTAVKKKIVLKVFLTSKAFFSHIFLLVSSENWFKVNCKKEKVENFF
jgi:hypothetical protein